MDDNIDTAREFHYGECRQTVGPRGGVTITQEMWRRNGRTQHWVRSPERFRIPVKFGLYRYGEITEQSHGWHTAAECPLAAA